MIMHINVTPLCRSQTCRFFARYAITGIDIVWQESELVDTTIKEIIDIAKELEKKATVASDRCDIHDICKMSSIHQLLDKYRYTQFVDTWYQMENPPQ